MSPQPAGEGSLPLGNSVPSWRTRGASLIPSLRLLQTATPLTFSPRGVSVAPNHPATRFSSRYPSEGSECHPHCPLALPPLPSPWLRTRGPGLRGAWGSGSTVRGAAGVVTVTETESADAASAVHRRDPREGITVAATCAVRWALDVAGRSLCKLRDCHHCVGHLELTYCGLSAVTAKAIISEGKKRVWLRLPGSRASRGCRPGASSYR